MTDAELDEAMAREVMRWMEGRDFEMRGGLLERPHIAGGYIVHYYPWSPTRDARHAMEVVERMRSFGEKDKRWIRFVWALPGAVGGVHALIWSLSNRAIAEAALEATRAGA